jgi:hypothetical protein
MSKVVSIRLKDEQATRLARAARALDRTPSETIVLLLEEALRRREFAFIEFRDSAFGRQAFLQGSRLAVWQAELIARDYDHDVARVAEHLLLPDVQVQALLASAGLRAGLPRRDPGRH